MQPQIPARIIQTAKTRDLPLMAQAAMANLKCLNPGFEHRFFDDQEVNAFVQSEFPQYFELFQSFPYRIQKYDFFRYLAVFRLGGFYFDLDVFLARGLEELRGHSCVFPFEEITINRCLRRKYDMDWEIGNYAFGAAPGDPFINAVCQSTTEPRLGASNAARHAAMAAIRFRGFEHDGSRPGFADFGGKPTISEGNHRAVSRGCL